MSLHPVHRRSASAPRGFASHSELPKMVGTIPTYSVYDKIAGLLQRLRRSEISELTNRPHPQSHEQVVQRIPGGRSLG